MTGNDEDMSMKAIEIGRTLGRSLAMKLHERGISPEDIGLASLYTSFDIAAGFKGDQLLAIEWLRTGIDVIERQLMDGRTVQ